MKPADRPAGGAHGRRHDGVEHGLGIGAGEARAKPDEARVGEQEHYPAHGGGDAHEERRRHAVPKGELVVRERHAADNRLGGALDDRSRDQARKEPDCDHGDDKQPPPAATCLRADRGAGGDNRP